MLQPINQLHGTTLTATDGEIGRVKDFYFDDTTWAIRYVVADTGTWLPGRQVLLSPHAFGPFTTKGAIPPVNLTRKQIEDSPAIETHRPVSRQYEVDTYRYYGWPAYWQGAGMLGVGMTGAVALPMEVQPLTEENKPHHGHHQRDDVHLRSTQAIKGYAIHATDGEIGTVSGFLMNRQSWIIRDLIVETGHWYAGKEILIAPGKIKHFSYEDSAVFVNLTKADLERTAENKVAKAAR